MLLYLLICNIYLFLWCKYNHYDWFQAIHKVSLNTELEEYEHSLLLQACRGQLCSTPTADRERWWGGGQTEDPSISKMENSQPFGVTVYLLKAKKLQLEQLARDSTDSQNAFWVTHLKKSAGPGGVKPDNNKKVQYYLTCSLSLPPTTGRSKNRRVKEVGGSRPTLEKEELLLNPVQNFDYCLGLDILITELNF